MDEHIVTVNGETVFQLDDKTLIPLLVSENQPEVGEIAMFRPHDIGIATSIGKYSNPNTAIFRGVVSYREFLGNRVRYSVNVTKHVIVVNNNYCAGKKTFGQDVF